MKALIELAYYEFFFEKNLNRMTFVLSPNGKNWVVSMGNTYVPSRTTAQEFFNKIIKGDIVEVNQNVYKNKG